MPGLDFALVNERRQDAVFPDHRLVKTVVPAPLRKGCAAAGKPVVCVVNPTDRFFRGLCLISPLTEEETCNPIAKAL